MHRFQYRRQLHYYLRWSKRLKYYLRTNSTRHRLRTLYRRAHPSLYNRRCCNRLRVLSRLRHPSHSRHSRPPRLSLLYCQACLSFYRCCSYCLPVLSRQLRSLSLCQLHLASSGCTNSCRRSCLRHPCLHWIARRRSLALAVAARQAWAARGALPLADSPLADLLPCEPALGAPAQLRCATLLQQNARPPGAMLSQLVMLDALLLYAPALGAPAQLSDATLS